MKLKDDAVLAESPSMPDKNENPEEPPPRESGSSPPTPPDERKENPEAVLSATPSAAEDIKPKPEPEPENLASSSTGCFISIPPKRPNTAEISNEC
jgi:hypothetical protein